MKEAKVKILLVEDDVNFGNVMKGFLELQRFEVVLGKDGNEGLHWFRKGGFDCCILDVMMPNMDGFTLARELRSMDADVPLIFLTAKTLKQDIIEGFTIGADDYITKPFDTDVLLYKIRAILRRKFEPLQKDDFPEEFKLGLYSFNYKHRLLSDNKSERILSPREAELLRMLCLHINEVLPRTETLKVIWKEDNYFTARSMDVYITRLRNYLKKDVKIEIINIHGNGFKLATEEN